MQDEGQFGANRDRGLSPTWTLSLTVILACTVSAVAGSGIGAHAIDTTSSSASFDKTGLDRNARAGDDFDRYVNAAWRESVVIPPDRGSYSGVFDALRELSTARTRTLLEEAQARRGSKIGDLYASFMDEAAADRKGTEPLRPWINRIAATKDKAALAQLAASLQRQGVPTLYTLPGPLSQPVSPDDKAPRSEVFHLLQGGLGLPDRDFYLKDDRPFVEARTAYTAYVAQLLVLAGQADAAARASAVVAFESGLAKVHATGAEERDIDRAYNPWTPTDFATKAPGFDWGPYLAGLGLSGQRAIIVAEPGAFAGEARLWATTPLAVLKDHLLVRALDRYAPYLSRPFVDASFAFHGAALNGLERNRSRAERGVDLLDLQMRDAVGQAYLARYFPPEAKAAADRLVRTVIAAWRERLKTVAWMAPATREETRRKLANLRALTGGTAHPRDYARLVVARDDLVGDVQRAYAFEFQHQLDKLAAPTERDDWDMTPMRADGYEDPVKNIVALPAALLQPPLFDPRADLAVTYGSIGAFVGHEISHLFDDQGRKYDPDGRLRDWWTPRDVARYTAMTDQLVRQYDAYEPLPGQHIQGEMVLGETMADLAGITVGRQAYAMALAGRPAPVVDGFTGDQRFYIGWARMWRVKWRDAALRTQLLSDPHPPGPERAAIVRNRDGWYSAFHVQAGERLYLDQARRVQIW